MWVPDRRESRECVVGLYHRAWEHAAGTFAGCDLDTEGRVPWWPAEEPPVTLHQILVHVIAETYRHAGHADIVRETIDGAAGRRAEDADHRGRRLRLGRPRRPGGGGGTRRGERGEPDA